MAQKKADKKKIETFNVKPVMKSLLPAWIIYAGFTAWAIFVLSHYFSVISTGSILSFFDNTSFAPALFLPRLAEHLKGILSALAVFIAAYGIGSLAVIPLLNEETNKSMPETINIFPIPVGLGILALTAHFIGIAGLLYKPVFLCIIGVFAVVGIIKGKDKVRLPMLGYWELTEKLIVLILIIIALFNLIGALVPETFFDAQLYQLGLLNKWIQSHKISQNTFILQSYFPFNINMLYLIGMMLRDEITAKLIHYFCGLFLVYCIYMFSRRFFSRRTALLAAVIFYSVPLVMLVSTKSAIELGIGVFEFTTVIAIVNYTVSRRLLWLGFAGVLCGFSLGSKYTSVVLCFFPAVAAIFYNGIQNKLSIKDMAKALAVFVFCAGIISLPWYLQNFISTGGNPVFPFFWKIIGHEKIKMTSSLFSDPPMPAFTLFNYLCFLWPFSMGTLQQETYPGAIFLVTIPFIFIFMRKDPMIKLLLTYAIVSMAAWIFFGRFYLRFFIPALPVVSIIFAYHILEQPTAKYFRNLLILLILILAFLNLSFSSDIVRVGQNSMPYFMGLETKKEYLSTSRPSFPSPYYQTLSYANEHLPQNAKILLIGETRGLGAERDFLASGPSDFTPIVEWSNSSSNSEELYARLCAGNFTHILLNVPEAKRLKSYDILYWSYKGLKNFDDLWKQHVREVYRDIGDFSFLQQGIVSMKRQQPQWWQRYASDPMNYVYLYEILPSDKASLNKNIPPDFLTDANLYTKERWEKITH